MLISIILPKCDSCGDLLTGSLSLIDDTASTPDKSLISKFIIASGVPGYQTEKHEWNQQYGRIPKTTDESRIFLDTYYKPYDYFRISPDVIYDFGQKRCRHGIVLGHERRVGFSVANVVSFTITNQWEEFKREITSFRNSRPYYTPIEIFVS